MEAEAEKVTIEYQRGNVGCSGVGKAGLIWDALGGQYRDTDTGFDEKSYQILRLIVAPENPKSWSTKRTVFNATFHRSENLPGMQK